MAPGSAVRRSLRELPVTYWVLWVGTLVNRSGNLVVPFLAIYVGTMRGYGEVRAGLVMSLYGTGSFLGSLAGGILADRIGRRFTIVTSLLGGACAMAALGFARELPVLGVLAFLLGLIAEMYRPAVAAAVADLVPAPARPRAYAYLYWVANLAFAIAAPLAALAVRTSYVMLFAIDAATTLAYGFFVLFCVPETRPAEMRRQRTEGESVLQTILADRTFLVFVVLTFSVAFLMWQSHAGLALDMTKKGISPSSYGLLAGINGALIIIAQPILVPALANLSRTVVLAAGSLVMGVGFGLHALVSTRAGYALAIAIWTLGEIAILPTASAVVADLSPARLRGRYQGMSMMAWGAASALAPLIGTSVLAHAGSYALWGGCAGLMLLTALGHVAIGRARAARENAIEATSETTAAPAT